MKSKVASGFMLPSVIIISATLLIVSLSVTEFIITHQQSLVRGTYKQVAQTAAKSGADYAKEQFIATGGYNGTSEQTVVSNSTYRTTFAVTVLSTSPDGMTKKIESVGKIYLPAQSTTPLLSSDLRTSISATATSVTPDQFSPMAWYDASNNPTVHQVNTGTHNWTDNNTDTSSFINERASDGAQNNAAWTSNVLTLGYNTDLNDTAYTGMLFHLTPLPKTATINSAYIQFRAAGITSPGRDTVEIEALAYSATPHVDFAGPPAANQLRNQPAIAASASWNVPAWPVAGQSGVPQRSPDLSALVQAVLAQPQFNPATDHIAFRITRTNGNGTRFADRTTASLVVTYTGAGTPTQANNNDKVTIWDDLSGNGRNLIAAAGNEPTYRTAQQNGLNMVQFPYDRSQGGSGKYMQTIPFNLLAQAQAGTMFIVAQGTTNAGDNATMVRMDGSIPPEPNCIGGLPCVQRIYELARSGNGSNLTFYIQRSQLTSTVGQSADASNVFTGSSPPAAMVAGGVAFTPGSCNPSLDLAAIDVANSGSFVSNCPGSTSNPKSFQNALTISAGTGRAGAVFDGMIGEVILYDKQLSCQQVASIQIYLRQKWFNDSTNSNIVTCPAPQVSF